MVLKDILAISGEQGLFRFLAQGKNAIIVEHLETKKRSTAQSSAKVSSLEDIAIFTETEDMPLGKVFDLIHEKENGGPALDHKSDQGKLVTWFEGILPEYSRNKVYASDIRKVAQWYNILHKLNLLVKEEDKPEEPKPEEGSETSEATGNEKVEATKKSVAAKKSKKQSPEA
jgi:hypothetical protein